MCLHFAEKYDMIVIRYIIHANKLANAWEVGLWHMVR